MKQAQSFAGLCLCGCSMPTTEKRIQALELFEAGMTPPEIGAEMGVTRQWARRLLVDPPAAYRLGHWAEANPATERTCLRCGRPFRARGDTPFCWRRGPGGRIAKTGTGCYDSPERRAFQQAKWAAHDAAVQERMRLRSLERDARRAEKAAGIARTREEARQERERIRDQIDWLRNQVGLGWRTDKASLFDYGRVARLDMMLEDRGDWAWTALRPVEDNQEDPQLIVAGRMATTSHGQRGDQLIRRALHSPEALDQRERDELRRMYEEIEGALLGESPRLLLGDRA